MPNLRIAQVPRDEVEAPFQRAAVTTIDSVATLVDVVDQLGRQGLSVLHNLVGLSNHKADKAPDGQVGLTGVQEARVLRMTRPKIRTLSAGILTATSLIQSRCNLARSEVR